MQKGNILPQQHFIQYGTGNICSTLALFHLRGFGSLDSTQKNKSKILPQKTMRGGPQASWRGGRQMVQTRTTILTRLIMLIPIGFGNKTNDKKQIMTQILR